MAWCKHCSLPVLLDLVGPPTAAVYSLPLCVLLRGGYVSDRVPEVVMYLRPGLVLMLT